MARSLIGLFEAIVSSTCDMGNVWTEGLGIIRRRSILAQGPRALTDRTSSQGSTGESLRPIRKDKAVIVRPI